MPIYTHRGHILAVDPRVEGTPVPCFAFLQLTYLQHATHSSRRPSRRFGCGGLTLPILSLSSRLSAHRSIRLRIRTSSLPRVYSLILPDVADRTPYRGHRSIDATDPSASQGEFSRPCYKCLQQTASISIEFRVSSTPPNVADRTTYTPCQVFNCPPCPCLPLSWRIARP